MKVTKPPYNQTFYSSFPLLCVRSNSIRIALKKAKLLLIPKKNWNSSSFLSSVKYSKHAVWAGTSYAREIFFFKVPSYKIHYLALQNAPK